MLWSGLNDKVWTYSTAEYGPDSATQSSRWIHKSGAVGGIGAALLGEGIRHILGQRKLVAVNDMLLGHAQPNQSTNSLSLTTAGGNHRKIGTPLQSCPR